MSTKELREVIKSMVSVAEEALEVFPWDVVNT
jgi:hypothetical protein